MFLGRQQDHEDGESVQPEEMGSRAVSDEENDQFWGLDDIQGTLFNGDDWIITQEPGRKDLLLWLLILGSNI